MNERIMKIIVAILFLIVMLLTSILTFQKGVILGQNYPYIFTAIIVAVWFSIGFFYRQITDKL